jgi:hypothetical protein
MAEKSTNPQPADEHAFADLRTDGGRDTEDQVKASAGGE